VPTNGMPQRDRKPRSRAQQTPGGSDSELTSSTGAFDVTSELYEVGKGESGVLIVEPVHSRWTRPRTGVHSQPRDR
jgi:hypothetical protein